MSLIRIQRSNVGAGVPREEADVSRHPRASCRIFPIPPGVERHDAPDVADLPALRQPRPPGPDDFTPESRGVIREHGPEPRIVRYL